jgi:hypothetical protein
VSVRGVLARQLDIAWSLLWYHLEDLGDEECLWRPAGAGLHVYEEDGRWRPDWPETESYTLGPPSIAWTTWHIGFWWSMALDHSFGDARLRREDVVWPGSAAAAREWIERLHREWTEVLEALSDDELASAERTRWPITEGPFHGVVAWLNLELMKNAAEIGYGRFLYAAGRPG